MDVRDLEQLVNGYPALRARPTRCWARDVRRLSFRRQEEGKLKRLRPIPKRSYGRGSRLPRPTKGMTLVFHCQTPVYEVCIFGTLWRRCSSRRIPPSKCRRCARHPGSTSTDSASRICRILSLRTVKASQSRRRLSPPASIARCVEDPYSPPWQSTQRDAFQKDLDPGTGQWQAGVEKGSLLTIPRQLHI